jgi:hypothetical protein
VTGACLRIIKFCVLYSSKGDCRFGFVGRDGMMMRIFPAER